MRDPFRKDDLEHGFDRLAAFKLPLHVCELRDGRHVHALMNTHAVDQLEKMARIVLASIRGNKLFF